MTWLLAGAAVAAIVLVLRSRMGRRRAAAVQLGLSDQPRPAFGLDPDDDGRLPRGF